jgi:hypothetical protein
VRYGVDTRWVQKDITGTATCGTATFGSDPAVGTLKTCQVSDVVPAPAPAPPPAPTPTPGKVTLQWVSPLNGSAASGVVTVVLRGANFKNVEIFNASSSPPMVARCTLNFPDITEATANIDTSKFPNGPLTLTAHAWNSNPGLPFTSDADAGALTLNISNAGAPPAPTPAPPPPAPGPLPNDATLFGDMVGLGVKFEQGQPLSEMGSLIDLKVRWIRSDVWASHFNAATGVYTMSATMQAMTAFCAANNIGISALVQMGAATLPVDFAKFALEVAKAFKATGVKFVLELGNEAHNALASLGGNWQGKEMSAGVPSPWVARYMQLLAAASDAVKLFDPAIKTFACDDMWICHYWFLQAGLPPGIAGHAYHPYAGSPPEECAVAWNTDWCQPFQCVDIDKSVGSAVRRLREQHVLKRGKLPDMWATEQGFAQGEVKDAAGVVVRTAAQQESRVATYLPRAFVLASEARVDVQMWFSSQDGPDGPMGLKDNTLRARPAYNAFKTMAQQLSTYKRAKRVAGLSRPLIGVQAFVLDGATDRKVVVWTANSVPVMASTPSATATAVDMFGAAIQNSATMQFSGSPIYFTTTATDAELATWAATL